MKQCSKRGVMPSWRKRGPKSSVSADFDHSDLVFGICLRFGAWSLGMDPGLTHRSLDVSADQSISSVASEGERCGRETDRA
ncbi:MAG: hypothetical protein L0219_18470, partial [Phycisphaerales bacterium]|nr:hypothetical protein [Phycisphaerales bacterium]